MAFPFPTKNILLKKDILPVRLEIRVKEDEAPKISESFVEKPRSSETEVEKRSSSIEVSDEKRRSDSLVPTVTVSINAVIIGLLEKIIFFQSLKSRSTKMILCRS